MEKGKTIKQIADEIGVSKQAVHQKRKSKALSTNLQPFTTTVDGAVYISVDGETIIKQAFLGNGCKQVADNEPSTSFTPNDKLYDILKGELEAKNQQIEELQRELSKEREHSREQASQLAVFTDQSQKLQLAQMQTQMIESASSCEAGSEAPTKPRWKFWSK